MKEAVAGGNYEELADEAVFARQCAQLMSIIGGLYDSHLLLKDLRRICRREVGGAQKFTLKVFHEADNCPVDIGEPLLHNLLEAIPDACLLLSCQLGPEPGKKSQWHQDKQEVDYGKSGTHQK